MHSNTKGEGSSTGSNHRENLQTGELDTKTKKVHTKNSTDRQLCHYLNPFWANTTVCLNRINPAVIKQSLSALNKLRWGCGRPFQDRLNSGHPFCRRMEANRLSDFKLAPVEGRWQLNSNSPMTFLSSFSFRPRKFCITFVRIINGYHVSTGPQWIVRSH